MVSSGILSGESRIGLRGVFQYCVTSHCGLEVKRTGKPLPLMSKQNIGESRLHLERANCIVSTTCVLIDYNLLKTIELSPESSAC